MIKELCYKIEEIPDLSLKKYASLDGSGVEGVLEKHLAFLRQWNRKGALSGTSVHLYYYYDGQRADGRNPGIRGSKLKILFVVRGEEDTLENVPQLVSSSTLSDYFKFTPCTLTDFLAACGLEETEFSVCSTLTKKEVFVRSSLETSDEAGYYTVPVWEMNEEGRLYNMCKLMESLDRQMLYRVDLYPVERSTAIREALRKPMAVLRERQYVNAGTTGQRDFEAENVLRGYEDLLSGVDSSPHFILNALVFAHDRENAAVVMDAAGAEALCKGNYEISSFTGSFSARAFLDDGPADYFDRHKKMMMEKGQKGLMIYKEESRLYTLKYLPTLFTLEEAAPFFRFPALYEGESVPIKKETAPPSVSPEESIYLGTDDQGYDVYVPLKMIPKHILSAGMPGSGKTNAMHHLASTLWTEHHIPFLVLEPAKQEYRALANQKGMEDLYVFAPNADMTFPLHINPFEFPKGLMLAEHIRRLCSVFEGAFPLDNPMPFLLDQAIEAVYREQGWTPETVYTDQTRLKFPTMSRLYERLEEELKNTTYSEEIRGNLESALKVRIGSLLRREMGDVFDVTSSTIPPEKWLTIPAVIELESMGTGPANFLTLMLCTLIRETLKVNPHYDQGPVRHVIFIEEAHNLIGPESEEAYGAEANPKQAATAFVVKMLAEVRALKEGIVIADQLPTVMAPEVIKNTGLKIGLRITSADDRNLLGSTMAANPIQVEEMATFTVGRSLVSYEGLMRPFTMQIHEWCGPWGTPHCDPEKREVSRCKAHCPHYAAGNCVPEESERRRITTSPSDARLAEIMRDRRVYREICESSFRIESGGLARECAALSGRAEKMITRLEKINRKEAEIKKQEAHVAEMSEELLSRPDWEEDLAKQAEIREAADYVGQLKLELQSEERADRCGGQAYQTIVDCIALAHRIETRKKHWTALGIDGFDEPEQADLEQPVGIARLQYGVMEIQKYLILQAQRVFAVARLHLSDPSSVRRQLERSAQFFKTKNILSNIQ